MINRKRNILHFIDSGGLYGAENVILNLSREMMAHGEYKPIVGCIVPDASLPNALYEKSVQLGIEAIKIQIKNTKLWRDLPKAARLFKALGIDMIHCHGYKAFVFAFLISKITRIPVVSTCHLWFLKGDPPIKMRIMVKLELFFYRFVPLVIAVSEPIKNFLMCTGVRPHRIKVIGNGVRLQDFQVVDQININRLRRELKIDDEAFVVLNAGRLSPQKSQRTIIDSAKLLKYTGDLVQFLIIGEGELRSDLESRITEYDLGDVVKLLGFRSDIRDLLQISDVFLLPSLDEGMPISLLEAVASETPVISTMGGDIAKIIHNKKSGIAVAINDSAGIARAILKLKSDPEKSKRLAKSALKIMQNVYSSEHMYFQYRGIYFSFLQD